MIRPKLASSPKIADLTKFELTIVLVKSAIFGEDANFGRIITAIGYSGCDINPHSTYFLASDIDLAPETLTLINFVAPSPSLAIALAKNVQHLI
jgi:glutamate N-acetyltransferase/amino-acid N-acetyltransferase